VTPPGGEAAPLSVRDLRAGPLRGVSLGVAAGEVVAVVGHGGAGKTTLAEVAAGLRRPDAGDVSAGAPVAYVPDGRRVFPSLTVDENLALGAYRDRRDKARVAARREAIHERFPRLAERRRQAAGTLSGGEQQLLVIARALMAGPQLLVLDEPSSGLGPRAIALVAEALRSSGTAVLLADQGLQLARALAGRVVLLEEGRVVLDQPRDTALVDPRLGLGYLRPPPG
jgi:branched-chain amino acid transport system ATP-binding protein